MHFSIAQLQQLAASVGFNDPATAAAVAMAESGGNPGAYGDAQYGGSVGLWQINLPAHPEFDPAKLTDPTYNAQAAYTISVGGSNWKPWTTYRTGAYLRYLAPYVKYGKYAGIVLVGGLAVLAWGSGWIKV